MENQKGNQNQKKGRKRRRNNNNGVMGEMVMTNNNNKKIGSSDNIQVDKVVEELRKMDVGSRKMVLDRILNENSSLKNEILSQSLVKKK